MTTPNDDQPRDLIKHKVAFINRSDRMALQFEHVPAENATDAVARARAHLSHSDAWSVIAVSKVV